MPKKFVIYHPDYFGSDIDDLPEIEAFDPEHAVEEFASEYDGNGDYTIANGNDQVFAVKEVGSENPWEFYRIHAEPDVNYYGNKQECPDEYKKDIEILNTEVSPGDGN